jgi:DNA repair protein RadC
MGRHKKSVSEFLEIMEKAADYISAVKPKCSEPEEAYRFLRPNMDPRNNVLNHTLATIGLADRSQLHAREVFRDAIVNNATRIILAHNHPSGDVTPSAQDISITRSLVEAGKIIGIEVIDHIIIGEGFCSLRRCGHI